MSRRSFHSLRCCEILWLPHVHGSWATKWSLYDCWTGFLDMTQLISRYLKVLHVYRDIVCSLGNVSLVDSHHLLVPQCYVGVSTFCVGPHLLLLIRVTMISCQSENHHPHPPRCSKHPRTSAHAFASATLMLTWWRVWVPGPDLQVCFKITQKQCI